MATKCHLNLSEQWRRYQRPPVSQYVSQHPGDGRVTHSTGHGGVSEHNAAPAALLRGPWYPTNNLPSMCLSLLDQAEPRSSWEGGAGAILPARQRDRRQCGDVCLLVYGRASSLETEVATMQSCQCWGG